VVWPHRKGILLSSSINLQTLFYQIIYKVSKYNLFFVLFYIQYCYGMMMLSNLISYQ